MNLPALPVCEALPALRRALAASSSAVLTAPPGSGKTTVVPLALLDEPWLAGRRILLLEPRRMAARAMAHGLNIDYFPTNFVIRSDGLWYIDYECNAYKPEWDFEHWGVRYWSRTPELETWIRQQSSGKEKP